MRRSSPEGQQGFLIIWVVLVLAVLAAMALMISSSASMENALVAKHTDSAALVYVTKAGMDHAKWQLAQSPSCTSYADLPATSFGTHSYSATVTPTSGTPVTLTATGTLADGVTRTLTQPDVAVYQLIVVPLQPGSEGDDAEIWDQGPDNNYGDSAQTWVSSATNDTTRSLLRFNIGAIPSGVTVLGAALSLLRESGSGADQPVSAHRITNQWSEGAVTWNSRESGTNWDTVGGDFDNMAVATTPVGPVNQRYEWNITPLVQGWVDGSYPNYGVALIAAIAGMSGERFYTSDESNLDRRPSLVVTYGCECGTVCAGGGGGGGGPFRDEFNTEVYSGSDGTQAWATDWLESGEGDGPVAGKVEVLNDISDFQLQLREKDRGVEREADLSGYTSATLTFDYRREALGNADDYLAVEISSNGGSTWTEIDRLVGPGTDSSYQGASYDISAHIAVDTRIRLKTSGTNGKNDKYFIDNVEISAN